MRRAEGSATFTPRVYAVVGCGIAIMLLLVGIIPLPSLFVQAPAPPAAALRTIPNTDVNPYGGNFFLDWEVEPWKVEKTLQMAKDAGLGWASLHFVWEGLEPKKSLFWDERLNKSTWDKYDFIVRVAEKHGLKIIARLDRPPNWTRRDNRRQERPPDDFNDYGDFVDAVVSRYRGRIQHYQIWNEPNIYPEWGEQDVNPADYVRLLKVAYERTKRADPTAYILSAPLAQTTEIGPRNLNELDFLDAMYRAGAKNYFDILHANGYGFDASPDDPPDPGKLNFARVMLLRQVMERHGDVDKAVWFHEFGWNAAPESMPPEKLVWRRVSEQQQAEYTVRAIRKARAEWPWAGVFSIWYFRQDGHITPDQAEYYFRMVDPGFTPRTIYYAVMAEARGVTVAGPGSYQETNPALTVDSGWHHEPERLASGEAWLVGDRTGAGVTIKFVGTELALVTAKEPRGARLLVTVDGHAANLLPPGGEGRSLLDLYSPTPQLSVVVPVAAGLAHGQHTVRIVIAPERNPSAGGERAMIDGFQVGASSQMPWQTHLAVGAAGLAGALLVAVLWRSRRRANADDAT